MTEIEDSAFEGCTGLTSITIPNSVTEIGSSAFAECTSLTDILIGNSIKKINANVFDGCENLRSITIAAMTPPTMGEHDFDTLDFRTIKIRVPKGSLAAYQAADFWGLFWNIEEYDPNGIADVQTDVHNGAAPIYNLKGVRMTEEKGTLPTGIYIQEGKKFIVK